MAVALLVASIGTDSPVGADNFAPEQPGVEYRADSSHHTYCDHPSLPSNLDAYAHSAMQYLAAATDMTKGDVTCNTSTDVVWKRQLYLPLAATGLTTCVNENSSTQCDSFTIQIDDVFIYLWWLHFSAPPNLPQAPLEAWTHQTFRHELGHTTGLNHVGGNNPSFAAMSSIPLQDLGVYNFVWSLYTTHHIGHIDGAY